MVLETALDMDFRLRWNCDFSAITNSPWLGKSGRPCMYKALYNGKNISRGGGMFLFILAFVCAAGLILVFRAFSHELGLVDHPGGRKQHECPTPVVGGIAMFAAVAIVLLGFGSCTEKESVLLWCAAALMLLGLIDDKMGLNVKVRLAIQAMLSLIVILDADGIITHLGGIFGGGDITLGSLAIPFSMVAFVGGINSMNMIDGADGMAGKMAAITSAGVGAISWLSGDIELLTLVYVILGTLAGFLLFNSRLFVGRALVFMGDSGSMWLGLVLGWMMVQLTHDPISVKPALALWLFGIPVIDTLAVITRRLRRKASPFAPDRTHIHHVFQDIGLSVKRSVFLLSVLQCMLVGIGLMFYIFKVHTSVVLGSFVLLMAAYFYVTQRFHVSPTDLARASGETTRR